ncbi:MAG TPA: bifunctional hydroxymethylpyrimidine kinase/phosphomethylpyrimidine kinase [Pyrinomonadaceae bacterium]|jgi:hydroxymethylpyrimidine kinase/phosphomethylpyrimidine kinase
MWKGYLDLQEKRENLKSLDEPPVCLTIAGHDPSGGAGIVADIKTFTAFGCFATAAITSLTFQNTTGVFGATHQTAETIRGQVEPVIQDFPVAAVKTGMLPTGEIIEETARLVRENNLPNFVVDPVVRSTSGFDLIDDAALRILIEKLFPLAAVVTPNIAEAERITNLKIETEKDRRAAAEKIRELGARAVLIKGGHFANAELENQRTASDLLLDESGFTVFEAEWIETTATHGTGCTLASAIAANLALGKDLKTAISIAKKFVTEAIRTAPRLGHGNSPVNHGFTVLQS